MGTSQRRTDKGGGIPGRRRSSVQPMAGPIGSSAKLRDDLLQQLEQRLGRRYIRRVAGVDFEVAPARLAFGALGEGAKGIRGRGALGVDIVAGKRQFAA